MQSFELVNALMLNPILGASGTTVKGFWAWLTVYIGSSGSQAIQWVLTIGINLTCVFIIIVQFFRLFKYAGDKNAEDAGLRAQSKEGMKNAIVVVLIVIFLGLFGFNILNYVIGNVIEFPSQPGN